MAQCQCASLSGLATTGNQGGLVSSIIFKACRRCAGDLYLEADTDGEYLTCIRCGYVTYPQNELKRTAMFPEETSAMAGVAAEGS